MGRFGDWLGSVVPWSRRDQVRTEQSWVSNPAPWLQALFGGGESATGKIVTPDSALRSGPVFACVRVISEDLSSLPFLLYQRMQPRGRERAPEHPLFSILHDAPNPEMDAMQFVETMQAHSELRPCAYAEIVRDGSGKITALWPLHPDRVTPIRVKPAKGDAAELVYQVTLPSGQVSAYGSPYLFLARDRVFRLRGLSLDGVTGLGTVGLQSEAIGLTLALEEYGARFFANGAQPGGLLEHPKSLTPQAYERLKVAWQARHQGLSNVHRIAILEEGMKWQSIGLQNDHAQWVESRRFQVEEVARIWRVPPHLIQDLSRSTNNNIEHQGIDYTRHTIRPRAVRWERAVYSQLLTLSERKSYYAEFLLDALQRGDLASRYTAYKAGRDGGWLSVNDIRERENENPIEGGDEYLKPLNMTTVGAPAPEPKAPAPDLQRAMEATRRLLVDAAARALRKEQLAVTKAAAKAKNAAEFEASARAFYADFESEMRSVLEPPLLMLAALVGQTAKSGDPAKAHVRRSINALRSMIASGGPLAEAVKAHFEVIQPQAEEIADDEIQRAQAAQAA